MNKITCLFFTIGLVSCVHKTDSLFIEKTATVVIDETKNVLMRLPQNVRLINDSTIAALNSSQKLSLYDIYSGKNERNFSLEKFNFDSLIGITYRKEYDGIKKFTYSTGYEINGSNYQLVNYYHTDNTFYVLVSLLAEVDNLKDSTEINKLRHSEETKRLGAEDAASFSIMEYVNFIFITDGYFKVKEIVPMYAETGIKKDNYFAYFHKRFMINNGYVYVPAAKTEENAKLEMKINAAPDNYAFVKIDLHDPRKFDYLIKYNDLDFTDYRLQDYFSTACDYYTDNVKMLFSTGKEIIDVTGKDKLFQKKNLADNEWMQDFYENADKNIVMTTYTVTHNGSVVISGKACPIDSLTGVHLKVFNPQTNKWLADVKLPDKAEGGRLTIDKVIFITKDEKGYYINYTSYHEN